MAFELTIVSVPTYAVRAVGVNVTLSLQVLPTATAAEQVPRVTLNGAAVVAEVMSSGLAPVLVTVRVTVLALLTFLVPNARVAGAENVVSTLTAVPLTGTTEGEPAALWAMLTCAVLAPAVVGAKRTLTTQLAAGITVAQVVLAMANCPASIPLRVAPDTTRFAVPVLVTVMAWVAETVPTLAEAKVSDAGETVAAGTDATPVPVSETLEGEPAALWAMLTEADFAPAVVGVNVTPMVQEAAGATGATGAAQPLVVANWLALVPPRVTPETTRLAVPVLLTVMVCDAEVTPLPTVPKASEAGETAAIGANAAPVPARPLRDGDGTLQVLCMVEDVTDRRLAEERARETESKLHRAVLDLTAVREPGAVIQATLRAARDVIDAESVAMVLVEGDGDGAGAGSLIVEDGDAAGVVGTVLRADPGIAVHVAAHGPLRMPPVGGGPDSGPVGFPGVAPLRSYLAVPVRFEDRLLATLHLGNRRHEAAFSDADVEVATVLGAQAAISLENARIHQRALALVQSLDAANTGLQQASETRSRLLASVSHELRTPLHSILMVAQLVRDSGLEQGGNRRVRGLGATIEGSGRHLLGLIDDFLDLSRIEVGAFELRRTPVQLGPLLREVRREMAPLAAEQGISLSIADVPAMLVVADPLRLRQVLLNLLSNAVKFTPRGGRIRLAVRVEEDLLKLSVADTGIGIAPRDIERAFLPFEQVSGTDTPGVGLGLAISRRIAELHGGTLTAASAIGRGSTFTVALPISDTIPRADERAGEPGATSPVDLAAPDGGDGVAAAQLPIEIVQRVGPKGTPASSLVAAR